MRLTLGQIYRVSIVATGVVASALALFGLFFLYNYAYRTVTETEYIVTLQREYAVEPLKYQQYRELLSRNENRRNRKAPDWSSANDPFRGY